MGNFSSFPKKNPEETPSKGYGTIQQESQKVVFHPANQSFVDFPNQRQRVARKRIRVGCPGLSRSVHMCRKALTTGFIEKLGRFGKEHIRTKSHIPR